MALGSKQAGPQGDRNWSDIAVLAVIGAGGLLLLAGLAMAIFLFLTAPAPDQTRQAAEQSAQAVAGIIGRIHEHLRHPATREQARSVLAGSPDAIDALNSELTARGIQNIIDLRVFPPRIEEIELGAYPEPDFSVAQMLIEARRQGSATAQVHYAGTPNENFALAEAVPGNEDEEPAGVIFLRLPVGLVTSQLADSGPQGWLRLVQGTRQIVLPASSDHPDVGGSRLNIDGSDLAVEWGVVTRSDSVFSLTGSLVVAAIGLAVLLAGLFVRVRLARVPARRGQQAGRAVQKKVQVPPRPVPTPAPKPPAKPAPAEPKPDLPDWLVDAGGGEESAGIFEKQEQAGAETDRSGDGTEDDFGSDVPGLDEILDQIEASGNRKAPERKGDVTGDTPPPETGQAPADAKDATRHTPERKDELTLEVPDLDEIFEQIDREPQDGRADKPEDTRPQGPDLDLPDPDREETQGQDPTVASAQDTAADLTPEAEPDLGFPDDSEVTPELGDELKSGTDSSPEFWQELDSEFEPAPESESGIETEPESDTAPQPEPAAVGGKLSATGIDRTLFRGGEIRGLVDASLDVERAALIGQAIGTVASQRGLTRIAVGRDGRFSGPLLMSALIRGLRTCGMDVVEVGAVPTPLLWFAATECTDGSGVMVTGSHHPADENGFLVMFAGELLDGRQIAEIADVADAGVFSQGEGSYEQDDLAERYAARLSADVQLERPLKVVVDCGNGIAGSAVPGLLEGIGADVIPLYCDVDGNFPNHPANPTVMEHLEDLRLCVRNFQADLGIAFDGDGDRLTLVTQQGDVVWADRLLMLLARAMLAGQPDSVVVYDVRCTSHLKRLVEEAGGRAVISPVGPANVARRLREEGAVLAGEMGGHIFLADRWYGFDDAIYAAARVLELLAADSRNFDDILAELPQFRFTSEMPIALDAERAGRLMERIRAEGEFGDGQVTTVDGVRVDHADCWGLIRLRPESGTLVICFGADDSSALARIKGEFRELLARLDPDLSLPY